jgi:hypothetical protein
LYNEIALLAVAVVVDFSTNPASLYDLIADLTLFIASAANFSSAEAVLYKKLCSSSPY